MGLFKRKIELKITEQENGAIVFDKTHGVYFQTNNVGTFILQQLSGGKNSAEITDAVAENFNIDRTQAETDVNEFLDSLKKAGIA
ncbi:PqqD family protein [Ruminococcus flavefaciens]|uniref:PqqD family protein n=1 Tax=Ruminococcus flavefaciens TaxID=1265 RepID=UPI0004916765|nr:PqqD family protein [Ruminococcus flavefaciens]